MSSFLLRVELPDVPGSLGLLAAAIGSTGANIEAIEIVEHRADGFAVDNVFVDPPPGVMPDSIVSACTQLDGVSVHWISRYTAGQRITRDLELVEAMTAQPALAAASLVEGLLDTFTAEWAMHLRRDEAGITILHRTHGAPESVPEGIDWPSGITEGIRFELPEAYADVLVAACPMSADEAVVMARTGGPEFLDSEIARLTHLGALARSIRAAALGA